MSLDIIFRWKCDECGSTHVESQGDFTDRQTGVGSHLDLGSRQITWLDLPRGWSEISGRMICPVHEVTIRPLEPRAELEMARDIYDGMYSAVPVPLPDELKPHQMKES